MPVHLFGQSAEMDTILAIARIVSISADWPNKCTGMMALVRGVMARSIRWGSMLKVSGSMSTKTGRAPVRAMLPAVAKNVNGGQMTSSPGPMPSTMSEQRRASVPLDMATPRLQAEYAARASSSCLTSGPLMYCWLSSTLPTAAWISSRMGVY
jgi:hypothetical protein